MRFEFLEKNGNRVVFEFLRQPHLLKRQDMTDMVDIEIYEPGILGGKAWIHFIQDGQVIWRNDNWGPSPEAKDFITKALKWRAFV
jgi:hypothetical protein